MTSSDTNVGTIVGSAGFNGGDGTNANITFHAKAEGSTTLTVGVPSGFSLPSDRRQITATVTP